MPSHISQDDGIQKTSGGTPVGEMHCYQILRTTKEDNYSQIVNLSFLA